MKLIPICVFLLCTGPSVMASHLECGNEHVLYNYSAVKGTSDDGCSAQIKRPGSDDVQVYFTLVSSDSETCSYEHHGSTWKDIVTVRKSDLKTLSEQQCVFNSPDKK